MVASKTARARTDVASIRPTEFRERLSSVEPFRRDDWVDELLGLAEIPPDGSDLPRGCVPYLPCSVDKLSRVVERAGVSADDVFVDVGSGIGRAIMFVHLLTGAVSIGLEIQAELARAAQRVSETLRLERVRTLHGDAEHLIVSVPTASVFLFYCPFGRERLLRVMHGIEPLARVRLLRLCFVDMPVPEVPWLIEEPGHANDSVAIRATRRSGFRTAIR